MKLGNDIRNHRTISKIIDVPETERTTEMDFVVTELTKNDGYSYTFYWVHCYGIVNAIVVNSDISGVGSKKFELEIRIAVETFKQNKSSKKTKIQNSKSHLRVIK